MSLRKRFFVGLAVAVLLAAAALAPAAEALSVARNRALYAVNSGAAEAGRILGVAGTRVIDGHLYVAADELADALAADLYWNAGSSAVLDVARARSENGDPRALVSGVAAGLLYDLYQCNDDERRLMFVVTNQGSGTVKLRFASGQSFDITLTRGGKEVWRASADMAFTQQVRSETLAPGQGRAYQVTLPPTLPPGSYLASAYFSGVAGKSAVAKRTITLTRSVPGDKAGDLERARASLDYELFVVPQPSLAGRPPAVVLIVANPGSREVILRLPSNRIFDVAVRDSKGKVVWRDSAGRVYLPAAHEETVAAYDTRVYIARPPGLAPGKYTVAAYYATFDTPVAEVPLTVK